MRSRVDKIIVVFHQAVPEHERCVMVMGIAHLHVFLPAQQLVRFLGFTEEPDIQIAGSPVRGLGPVQRSAIALQHHHRDAVSGKELCQAVRLQFHQAPVLLRTHNPRRPLIHQGLGHLSRIENPFIVEALHTVPGQGDDAVAHTDIQHLVPVIGVPAGKDLQGASRTKP